MPSHQQLSWAKWWESCRLALVLGPGNHVQSDPTVCTFRLTFDSVTQPDPSQEPGKSESTCLAPRAPATKEAGLP